MTAQIFLEDFLIQLWEGILGSGDSLLILSKTFLLILAIFFAIWLIDKIGRRVVASISSRLAKR